MRKALAGFFSKEFSRLILAGLNEGLPPESGFCWRACSFGCAIFNEGDGTLKSGRLGRTASRTTSGIWDLKINNSQPMLVN